MRRILIDTDTASDDAVALILALREESVRVEAITVVAGNVELDRGVKNALLAVQQAGTYAPPVYRGIGKPLMRDLFTATFAHGADGMGESDLPEPTLTIRPAHAVDAMIDLIVANPGDIEVIALGPLTNLAVAVVKEPRIARLVKNVTVMGTGGLGPGNITPAAEFNIYVDAEAADIVFRSGMPLTVVGWDASMGTAFLDNKDIDALRAKRSPRADFCLRINEIHRRWTFETSGKDGFDIADATTVAVALRPELGLQYLDLYARVETKSDAMYGHVMMDVNHVSKNAPNIRLCARLDGESYKRYLFQKIV